MIQWMKFFGTLLIYTLWYDFLSDFDAQSDFGQRGQRKPGPLEPFVSKESMP